MVPTLRESWNSLLFQDFFKTCFINFQTVLHYKVLKYTINSYKIEKLKNLCGLKYVCKKFLLNNICIFAWLFPDFLTVFAKFHTFSWVLKRIFKFHTVSRLSRKRGNPAICTNFKLNMMGNQCKLLKGRDIIQQCYCDTVTILALQWSFAKLLNISLDNELGTKMWVVVN